MALAKLTITPIGDSKIEPFKVLFNPTSYSISKSVSWKTPAGEDRGPARESNVTLNAPLLQFGGGQSVSRRHDCWRAAVVMGKSMHGAAGISIFKR